MKKSVSESLIIGWVLNHILGPRWWLASLPRPLVSRSLVQWSSILRLHSGVWRGCKTLTLTWRWKVLHRGYVPALALII